MSPSSAYDEVPYKSAPVEWTAPERLALTSLLHGGPVPSTGGYAMLEIGCADGSNLLPLAFYRQNARFVGVDGARHQIDFANERSAELRLSNVEFIHCDFRDMRSHIADSFDYIIAHGIISWVSDVVRDDLLTFCRERLRPGGLVYLNYNAKPGWNIRGMIREFLLAQTAGITGLATRAVRAQEIAARVLVTLPATPHPYSSLMADEFRIVCNSEPWYVAHEYLAAENRPYWESEFRDLASAHGLDHIADADFNYPSGRLPESLNSRLVEHDIVGRNFEDAIDLFCYRQMRFPIMTASPFTQRPLEKAGFMQLWIASGLIEQGSTAEAFPTFLHPLTGYEVDARSCSMAAGLRELQRHWPSAVRVSTLFDDEDAVVEDLKLLHRNGLIELRLAEAPGEGSNPRILHAMESRYRHFVTDRRHACTAVDKGIASIDRPVDQGAAECS